MFSDFLPSSKNKVIIITNTNLEIKFALLLNIAEAQSNKGSVLREFLIVSLSISILYVLSSEIPISTNIKTLLL